MNDPMQLMELEATPVPWLLVLVALVALVAIVWLWRRWRRPVVEMTFTTTSVDVALIKSRGIRRSYSVRFAGGPIGVIEGMPGDWQVQFPRVLGRALYLTRRAAVRAIVDWHLLGEEMS